MAKTFICEECHKVTGEPDYDDVNYGTGLCYYCFEDAVERAEERRRERIQRENEY